MAAHNLGVLAGAHASFTVSVLNSLLTPIAVSPNPPSDCDKLATLEAVHRKFALNAGIVYFNQ